jgi:glycosyltransferase involved in cell wall biosynthesis
MVLGVMLEAYVRPAPRAEDGPLVTVVIATYNRSEVLRYALRSALGQSYRNLEVIVVGDACTDDSEAVVASFGDPRVRWMNLAVNSGSGSLPNQAALEVASGEFVAYLGHDDLWRREHVALLVADLARTGADATHSACDSVFPGRLGIRRLTCWPPGGYVPPSSLMHRREAGLRAGGWRDYREIIGPPDADFVRRLEQTSSHSRVHALSAVKFPSASRRNSYRDHRCDEQARFSRRMHGRAFVAQEVAALLVTLPARLWRHGPKVDPAARARPGGVVDEYRRIRGLTDTE